MKPSDRMFERKVMEVDFADDDGPAPTPQQPDQDIMGRNGAAPPKPLAVAMPITSFAYPEGDDPNVLLGSDDYLGRGGGFLFVSHAGAGKSSWIMDACMSWSLGRPWMGIRSNGPLRSLIIQAEDSDRYVGKVQASFAHANALTAADIQQVGNNCLITRLKGVSGVNFQQELKRLAELHKPDLVVINPLYIYADGDIGRSEFAQPFLLGLDAINKAERFAYILVHHTGKPAAKGKDGKRATVEDWESVYQGFGSSYLANWPRCSALLEPVSGNPGHYEIKLGKGGFNAGVTKREDAGAGFRDIPVTRIPIKHSAAKMTVGQRERPVYYWESDVESKPEAEEGSPSNRGQGRKRKHNFEDYRSIFPPCKEIGLPLGQLHMRAIQNLPIDKNRLFDALKLWAQDGMVECIEENGQPRKYRLAV